MKRLIALAAAAALVLSGCSFSLHNNDKIQFFYTKNAYDHYGSNPVIGAENRDASGHRQDLRYLIALYLMGPVDQKLKCSFPKDTQLVMIEQTDAQISITLTDNLSKMSDAVFSLACACLSKTISGLTGAEAVTITSGSRSVTIAPETLLLEDTVLDSDTQKGAK